MAETSTTEEGSQSDTSADTADEKDWRAEAAKWQGLARKHEDRAKANSSAVTELEKLRQASMSEQEKAVAQAKEAARAETLSEVGISRAEDAIRFSVGDRLPGPELDALLDDLNLAKFVKEDGSLDRERITRYVERISPRKSGPLDLGQGARGGTSPTKSWFADALKGSRR